MPWPIFTRENMLNCFSAISAKGASFILFLLPFEVYFDIKHLSTHLEYHTSKLRINVKKVSSFQQFRGFVTPGRLVLLRWCTCRFARFWGLFSVVRDIFWGGGALEKRLISIICKYPGKIMEFSKFHLNSKKWK